MNLGLAIFKNAQQLQGGTPFVSNQAENVARMSPQERLFYEYTQEMLKKRELERQLRERGLDDEQWHEEEVQQLQGGTGDLNYDPSYPGPVNPKGSDSGVPTQKGVGLVMNAAGNLVFPGLGMLTGPLAQWAWRAWQSGMSQDAVQRAVQGYQQPQGGDDTSGGDTSGTGGGTTTTTPKTHSAGVGIDPMGNPAGPGEWWSNDFGRWDTDKYGTTPGNYWNQGGPGGPPGTSGVGFGGNTVGNWQTAIGFGGNLGGSGTVDASALGSGGMARNLMMKLAKGMPIGQNIDNAPAPPNMVFSPGTVISGPGTPNIINPAALGGMGKTQTSQHFNPKAEAQMGTSNVGLNLFRRKQQLRKPKQ